MNPKRESIYEQTKLALLEVDKVVASVEEVAQGLGVAPYAMRDANGNWIMAPLVVSQMQGMYILAILEALDIA